jgi:hypothetical protein
MACFSDVGPLRMPVRNVSVSTGAAVARGIEIGVGTPQQIVSVNAAFHEWDTLVSFSSQCEDDFNGTEAKCLAQSGGVYDPAESSTYSASTLSQWNGTSLQSIVSSDLVFFHDTLSFGTNATMAGLPMLSRRQGFNG